MEYPQYYLLIARWGGGGQLNTFLLQEVMEYLILSYYKKEWNTYNLLITVQGSEYLHITFVLQYKKDRNTYNLRITVQEGMEFI